MSSPLLPTKPIHFPRRLLFGLSAWVMSTLIGTEVWYRKYEVRETLPWSVKWLVLKKDFSNVSISTLEADALACDEERAAEWANGDGSHWTAFFFKWADS